MILDEIKNAELYKNVLPSVKRALEKVAEYTKDNYPSGRMDVDGDNLFLLFNSYETHSPEDSVFEAHQKYVDLMYMVEGEEIIYVKPTDSLSEITKPYTPEIDALLAKLDSDATKVRLTEGSFIVLFPQDAHSPACFVDSPVPVKKIIAKVRL